MCCTDLGGKDCLSGLWDHIELLDCRRQVTGGAQVGQTHKAALGSDVIMRPVIPLIRSVRRYKNKRVAQSDGKMTCV